MSASERNVVETSIMGEPVVLSSSESPEYIHKITEYIDFKAREIQKAKKSLPINSPLFKMLVNINMADDFFKAQEKIEELTAKLAQAEQELKEYEEVFEQA